MIPFNKPPHTGSELQCIEQAVRNGKISGDGDFTRKCDKWLEEMTGQGKVLLTTSCTHAIEMAAMLAGIGEGDEVVMPSYTFVSTANAFALRGARLVFTDIRPDTLNIDERLIEAAITDRTKAIVPVHYAGVACAMDEITRIAAKYGLTVIEDAAQGVMSNYKGRILGGIGDFGCYSFHETKNYSMGEGGAIVIRDEKYFEQAEIIREKGTDRSRFLRGQVDKYTWVGIGSSYLPGELNAAYLYPQLCAADTILNARLRSWHLYYDALSPLSDDGRIELPHVPTDCVHNAHMFYVKARDLDERNRLIEYLGRRGVQAVFHYIPLHSSPAGKRYGRFHGEDVFTTKESERLLRLPMYFGLKEEEILFVSSAIKDFYDSES